MVDKATALRAALDPARLRRLVEMLPAPRARLVDPGPVEAADAMIRDAFRSEGWQTDLRPFSTSVPDLPTQPGARSTVVSGVNIMATKEGASTDAVVVVAHHDTVPGSGGADDNGSGIAGLIELARLLGPKDFRRTIVLAAVDHEELGFVGSRLLVRELLAGRRVNGAFVLEMLA
jgi:acetylornithine deacetylase/succinyl-diaminopimelate desuccinylase-like protein